MAIPAWLPIGLATVAIAGLINALSSKAELRWFYRLKRPHWLTFEWLIPFIWMSIFICSGWSAYHAWTKGGSGERWWLMAGYALLEVLILLYTPVMCKFRSLKVGTAIGGIGFLWGFVLAVLVAPVSSWAVGLLLPYLLWSPVGTFVTWKMIPLNLESVATE